MPLTRSALDAHLAQVENMVPAMLEDRSSFPRLFEDQVEILLAQLPASDHDYALSQLEAIVERCGYNR
jgi:hypothetical protein